MELPAVFDCEDEVQAKQLSLVLREASNRGAMWLIYSSDRLAESVAVVMPGRKLVCGERLFEVMNEAVMEFRQHVREIAETN